MSDDPNQWSSVRRFLGVARPVWIPQDEQDRIAAYEKYNELYQNEPRQFSLRVLEGEQPLYIPNARVIVDTTAYYILKGLELVVDGGSAATKKTLQAFLDREAFYSRFHTAKHAGVAKGDFVFHLTGNPKKREGRRLSLNSVDPGSVFPVWDMHTPDKMLKCHLVTVYNDPNDNKSYVNKLTYELEEDELGNRRVSRQQGIYELEPKWYGEQPKLVRTILAKGYLDQRIDTIPVYWFRNRAWDGEDFGSSELRGFESLLQTVSQSATDVSASLSLEGLGVYATDGGRPVNDSGAEVDWEVAPGRVMEVPQGSYFRRVEGVTSITPATDQISYIERKMMEGASLSDVALGKVDAQVAQSGIALAIKFMPTLAKVEQRDQAGIARLKQLFYDWMVWHEVFEHEALEGEVVPTIGDKLPTDRKAKVEELNNMLDRRVISTKYYRDEMEKLGYEFPRNIQDQIDEDLARNAVSKNQQEDQGDDEETSEDDETSTDGNTLEDQNSSNNKDRPNESSGTEA